MTGPLAEVDLAILLPFAFGALVAMASVVVLSGFWPMRTGRGTGAGGLRNCAVVGASLATATLIVVLALTIPTLPTAVAIIALGAAILGAPFLVQPLPGWARDSDLAPVVVLALAAVTLVVLPSPF